MSKSKQLPALAKLPLSPSPEPAGALVEHGADQVAKAMEHRRRLHAAELMPLQVHCKRLGRAYGGGIGVYFKSLHWLQFMFLLMALCAVPFLVIINVTRFADGANKDRTDFGYKVHSSINLNSFTFSAILDDKVDKGMLKYMKFDFTYPFLSVHPYITKATFLTWISVLDAVATLAFVAIAWIYSLRIERFANHIDKATQEASDYTVVVRGLRSSATATEVGEHFARWGRVMDVVLIKDLGAILQYCNRMSNLQEDVDVAEHKASMSSKPGGSKKRLQTVLKLQNSLKRINEQVNEKSYPTHAAFVTFDHEHERKNCQLQNPTSWLGSILMKRSLRLNAKHRYWVESATPPEDYLYENLGYRGWWRRAAVQLTVIIILLLCGGAITKLQRTDRLNSTTIRWDRTGLLYAAAQGSTARALFPGSQTYNISNILTTIQGKRRSLQSDGDNTTTTAAQLNSTLDYNSSFVDDTSVAGTIATCLADLPGNCTASLQREMKANLTVQFGQFIAWNSTKDFLLKDGLAISKTKTCYDFDMCGDILQSNCYPCYCLGIYLRNETIRDTLVVKKIKSQCSEFIVKFDPKVLVIRVGISASVWVINTMLQLFLKQLVLFEKMDSRTNTEWLYAVYSFLAQLINSTVVLLLVSAGNARIEGLDGAGGKHLPRWVRKFIMNGSYTDFTPAWYQDVGASLLVLLFINALLNPLLGYLPVTGKALNRWWLFRKADRVPQEALNYAAVGPKFMLHERMASIMLDITLAMIFGSGMPLMYAAVLVGTSLRLYADRHILLRCSRKPNRYSTCLPMLFTKLLPVVAVLHCAVGLWMHTYFDGRFTGKAAAAFASGLQTLDSASTSAGYGGSASVVKQTSLWRRISQANGILLLILFVILVIAVIARIILVECFGALADQAWRRLMRACCMPALLESAERDAISYSDALCNRPRKLEGLPTYRVEHHPMYESSFRSTHYRIIWDQAYGRERYTRLVPRGRRRNTFDVIQDLILYEEDTSQQAVVLADANSPGVRHRVSRETVEHVGDGSAGELQPLETAPEGFIKALRAVTRSDHTDEAPDSLHGGDAPEEGLVETEPLEAPVAVSGAGLTADGEEPQACWAPLPKRTAELEMVEQDADDAGPAVAVADVVHMASISHSDDGTSPYALRLAAAQQEQQQQQRAAAELPMAVEDFEAEADAEPVGETGPEPVGKAGAPARGEVPGHGALLGAAAAEVGAGAAMAGAGAVGEAVEEVGAEAGATAGESLAAVSRSGGSSSSAYNGRHGVGASSSSSSSSSSPGDASNRSCQSTAASTSNREVTPPVGQQDDAAGAASWMQEEAGKTPTSSDID